MAVIRGVAFATPREPKSKDLFLMIFTSELMTSVNFLNDSSIFEPFLIPLIKSVMYFVPSTEPINVSFAD